MRTDASVIVLDLDDVPRRPASPPSAVPRRQFSIRPAPLLGIVIAHVAVVGQIATIADERVRTPETEPLVAVFVRPRIVLGSDPAAALPERPVIRVRATVPRLYDVPIPNLDRPTTVAMGVGTMVPQPADIYVDPTPFAQQAGLPVGLGATIVLRLEVLGSGELGRVEVDVSGGSEAIDAAAVAYARAMPWLAGAIDGRPEAMWIRWGVHLQG